MVQQLRNTSPFNPDGEEHNLSEKEFFWLMIYPKVPS